MVFTTRRSQRESGSYHLPHLSASSSVMWNILGIAVIGQVAIQQQRSHPTREFFQFVDAFTIQRPNLSLYSINDQQHHLQRNNHQQLITSTWGPRIISSGRRTLQLCSSLDEAADENQRKRGKSKTKKKKRRFVQDVSPLVVSSAQSPPPSPPDATRKNKPKNIIPSSRSPNKNDIMQTTKSIEELEQTMSKRWGTKLEKWTADTSEYEFVYESDDCDNDRNSATKIDSNSNRDELDGRGRKRKVRSKPILDPWQKAEIQKLKQQEAAKTKKKRWRDGGGGDNNDDDTLTNAGALGSVIQRRDTVLNRVRKNQERLRSLSSNDSASDNDSNGHANEQSSHRRKAKNREDLVVDEEDFPSDMVLEFYDEDDEGYEFESSRSSSSSFLDGDDQDGGELDFIDNIMSPVSAGKSGRQQGQISSHSRSIVRKDESSREGSGGGGEQGFFFNAAAAKIDTQIDNNDEQNSFTNKKRKVEAAPRRQPKLDENGSEMYLTLEQAKKNIDSLLKNCESVGNTKDSNSNVDNNDSRPRTPSTWQGIGITQPELLKNLCNSMQCPTPLSVQDKACPSIVSGNDVLISTHTGSGKTLAFLAPLVQRLLFHSNESVDENAKGKSGVKVIIIAPGRELASQIVAVARDLLASTSFTTMLAIGGTPFSRNFQQIRKKKPDILIGTPGRIAELVVGKPGDKSGRLKLSSLEAVVLDECDALVEYEPHRDPTFAIMEVLRRRFGDSMQCILCSATAGDLFGNEGNGMKDNLDLFLRPGYAHAREDDNNALITSAVDSPDYSGEVGQVQSSTTTRVSRTAIHGVVHVPHNRFALETLRKILYTDPIPQQVLIFVDNVRRVAVVVDKLAQFGIVAAPLHGGSGSEKGDRAEVNKALREGYVGMVVATEMAARGIDAPYLTHVINLDLPTDASHYAHRSGRCGRGGRPGVVINIAVGSREKRVPSKFGKALNIEMHTVEPTNGKLMIVKD